MSQLSLWSARERIKQTSLSTGKIQLSRVSDALRAREAQLASAGGRRGLNGTHVYLLFLQEQIKDIKSKMHHSRSSASSWILRASSWTDSNRVAWRVSDDRRIDRRGGSGVDMLRQVHARRVSLVPEIAKGCVLNPTAGRESNPSCRL
jgi:hypothetical protein